MGTNQKHGGDKCCLGNKWQYLKLQFRVCISIPSFFLRLKCFASLYHFKRIFSFSLPAAAAGSFSFLVVKKKGRMMMARSLDFSLISLRQDIVDLPPSFSFFYIMRPSLLCVNLFYILLHVPSNNNKSNPIASATVYRTASFAVSIRLV